MTDGDFHGFHFLPPSVHLPPVLQPVHGALTVTTIDPGSVTGMIAGAGAVLQHPTAAVPISSMLHGQT